MIVCERDEMKCNNDQSTRILPAQMVSCSAEQRAWLMAEKI